MANLINSPNTEGAPAFKHLFSNDNSPVQHSERTDDPHGQLQLVPHGYKSAYDNDYGTPYGDTGRRLLPAHSYADRHHHHTYRGRTPPPSPGYDPQGPPHPDRPPHMHHRRHGVLYKEPRTSVYDHFHVPDLDYLPRDHHHPRDYPRPHNMYDHGHYYPNGHRYSGYPPQDYRGHCDRNCCSSTYLGLDRSGAHHHGKIPTDTSMSPSPMNSKEKLDSDDGEQATASKGSVDGDISKLSTFDDLSDPSTDAYYQPSNVLIHTLHRSHVTPSENIEESAAQNGEQECEQSITSTSEDMPLAFSQSAESVYRQAMQDITQDTRPYNFPLPQQWVPVTLEQFGAMLADAEREAAFADLKPLDPEQFPVVPGQMAVVTLEQFGAMQLAAAEKESALEAAFADLKQLDPDQLPVVPEQMAVVTLEQFGAMQPAAVEKESALAPVEQLEPMHTADVEAISCDKSEASESNNTGCGDSDDFRKPVGFTHDNDGPEHNLRLPRDIRSKIGPKHDLHMSMDGSLIKQAWTQDPSMVLISKSYITEVILAWLTNVMMPKKKYYDNITRQLVDHAENDIDTTDLVFLPPHVCGPTIKHPDSPADQDTAVREQQLKEQKLKTYRRLGEKHKEKHEEKEAPRPVIAVVRREATQQELLEPKVPCHLRPAHENDMAEVQAIYNLEVTSGQQARDAGKLPLGDFDSLFQTCKGLSLPFIVAVYGAAHDVREGRKVSVSWETDENLPRKGQIIGFCFLTQYHQGLCNGLQSNGRSSVLMRVMVHPRFRRSYVSYGLIDKMMHMTCIGYEYMDTCQFIDESLSLHQSAKLSLHRYHHIYTDVLVAGEDDPLAEAYESLFVDMFGFEKFCVNWHSHESKHQGVMLDLITYHRVCRRTTKLIEAAPDTK